MKLEIFPQGFPSFVKKFERISSTNDKALEYLVEKGEKSNGGVFVAKYQENGRGRSGRSWYSESGKNLLMSFIFVPPADYKWNLLPLAAGLACVKAIEKYKKIAAKIKWPNDIVYNNRKMGGILSESKSIGNRILGVVVGIGINVKGGSGDFPVELSSSVVTMEEASKSECDVDQFMNNLLKEISSSLQFLSVNLKGFLGEVTKFLIHQKDDIIEISSGEGRVTGKYVGLNENGEIVLLSEKGIRTFNCGEIVKSREKNDSCS